MLVLSGLRDLRLDAALSQDDLGKLANVSRMTIVRGEKGHPLRLVSVRRLAKALGVRPQDLRKPAAQ